MRDVEIHQEKQLEKIKKMKSTIKLLLIITLFCGVVFAEGNQSSGGRTCPPEGCPPPPCTVNCGSNTADPNEFEDRIILSDYIDEVAEIIGQTWLLVL